jgi:PAS domain S-box-containing protein
MPTSFKYKFVISFVGVELFFILCIVAMNFFTIERSSGTLIKTQMESTITLMQELIKAPISVYDLATLDNIATRSNLQYVYALAIMDPQDKLLTYKSKQKIDISKFSKYKENAEININGVVMNLKYVPILNDDIKLGTLYVLFDVSEIEETIKSNKQNTAFLILLEIFISTIIAYIIGTKLTNSLTKLSNIATQIGEGTQATLDVSNSGDEVSLLSNAIKKMQDNIIARNKQLFETKKVFDNIQEAIVVFDSNGFVKLANNAFYKIISIDSDQLKNKKYTQFIGKENKRKAINILRYLKKSTSWQGEIKITYNDKHKIFLSNISKIEHDDQNEINYIGIFSDITTEKEKDKLIQIQSKMATMGEMIGHIAHQWRQPLSAISSISSGIQLEYQLGIFDEKELMHNLEIILQNVHYLSETIEDFRNFFKPDKNIEKFAISEVITKTKTILNDTLKNNLIELHINIEADPFICGFKNELIQAFLNIINNAKDALKDQNLSKKIISINTKIDSSNLLIEILDNAGGIPEKIIDKIFEPYFTTKHKSQGTGIGLYMTHTIITNHHKGQIFTKNIKYKFENDAFEGALFTVLLPL